MSCAGSCSTDSGVRNPSTTISFVAPGDGGGVGVGAAAGAGVAGVAVVSGTADVSDAGGARSARWRHAAQRAATVEQRPVALMGDLPPRLRLRCAAAPSGGAPAPAARRG